MGRGEGGEGARGPRPVFPTNDKERRKKKRERKKKGEREGRMSPRGRIGSRAYRRTYTRRVYAISITAPPTPSSRPPTAANRIPPGAHAEWQRLSFLDHRAIERNGSLLGARKYFYNAEERGDRASRFIVPPRFPRTRPILLWRFPAVSFRGTSLESFISLSLPPPRPPRIDKKIYFTAERSQSPARN